MKDLDFSQEQFSKLLDQTGELVKKYYADMYSKPAYQANPVGVVKSWFDELLPENGMDVSKLLAEADEKVVQTTTHNVGPHMYGYVMAGGTQVSTLAELLTVTVNQNLGKWHLGPSMNEIEQRVVKWGAEFIGYDHDDVAGVLVGGGSEANLAGLTVARNLMFEKLNVRKTGLFGHAPFIVYGSEQTHGCVDKSLEQLGIGTDNYRKIPTHDDYTINLDALREQIAKDKVDGLNPFCIIGNAGTVNTGAIDDLDALADIAEESGFWFHVDGAYGGLVASLDSHKAMYKGIERADSVVIDFHKWLYQPYEAGCVMFKGSWESLNRSYYKRASYLALDKEEEGRIDLNEHYFQLSRNSKAFKVWMSFKAYGAEAFRKMITKDIDLTKYLAKCVEEASDFKLFNQPDLSAFCFQYVGGGLMSKEEASQFNQKLVQELETDGRVFITASQLHSETVIRACLTNHRKQREHVDYLLEVIRDVAGKLIN